MMSSDPFEIRLQFPAETAAFVPYLLGFHPTVSLVVLGLDGKHVICAARADLPTIPDGDDGFRAGCQALARHLARRSAVAGVLLGYGELSAVEYATAIARTELAQQSIRVDDVLHVYEGRVRSLWCTDAHCCPPQGNPVADTSAAAASAVYAGLTAVADREALAATLQPLTGPRRAAFTAATAAVGEALIARIDDADVDPDGDLWATPAGQGLMEQAATLIDEGLQLYRAGQILDDEQAALLIILVAFPMITQVAVRRTSDEPWQIDMWTDLLRRAAPPFTAACAVVLTFCALQAGNGALAHLAIDRALHSDPEHRLARLLQHLVQTGVDPDMAARIVHT